MVASVTDNQFLSRMWNEIGFNAFGNPVPIHNPSFDFESARREEMNAYILGRYPGRTAMAGMMDTYRARGALREVGKALGIDGSEVDLICKTFPHISARAIPGPRRFNPP